MFAAIAFIQEDNAIRAYEALEEYLCLNGFEQQFRELLNYYEDTFIGRHNRTVRLIIKSKAGIMHFHVYICEQPNKMLGLYTIK
ncbi:hypothetical protein HZS_809 [Henneguya salminicola]|nr:hypothetical protein HZS_809 [Henneguya salminicola]